MDGKSIASHVTYLSMNQTKFQSFVFKINKSFLQFDNDNITSLGCLDTLRELAKYLFLSYYINTGKYPVTTLVKHVDLYFISLMYGQTITIDDQDSFTKVVRAQTGDLNRD